MPDKVRPEILGEALSAMLGVYSKQVVDRVNDATKTSMCKLVKLTQETAPLGKRNGRYARAITSTFEQTPGGTIKGIWHVKAPEYRLTHLLAKGHATKSGGRTKANPFLRNALDQILPEFEEAVEEALKDED